MNIAERVSKRKRGRATGVVADLAAAIFHHGSTAAATAAAPNGSPTATGTAGSINRSAAFSNHGDRPTAERAASRRRLLPPATAAATGALGAGGRPSLSPTPPQRSARSPEQQRHIDIVQSKLGRHKHHGTGNPLAVRSPTTPKTLAVDNLARIIQSGHLGQDRSDMSGSLPRLKTERGRSSAGSFWVASVSLAGHYGWTGLILPPNVDSSRIFPIENVLWFVLETEQERDRLEMLLSKSEGDGDGDGTVDAQGRCNSSASGSTTRRGGRTRWEDVKDRVVTLAQLAELIS